VPHPPGFPVRHVGVNELHAAFLKVIHRRCRPTGYETGHFLSSAESATNTRLFVVLPAVRFSRPCRDWRVYLTYPALACWATFSRPGIAGTETYALKLRSWKA